MSKSHHIDLYYWPTPNGQKILIALHEMHLSYHTHMINIGTGDQFKEDFLAIAPNNRIPAIVDHHPDHKKPLSIFESGAILMFLAKRYGHEYWASNTLDQVRIMEWLFWQMGGLGPMAGQKNHFVRYAPALFGQTIPYAIERYTHEVKRLFSVMNTQLGQHPYLAGKHYSIADIACFPWVYGDGIELSDYPHLQNWHQRIEQRPAVIAAAQVQNTLKADYERIHGDSQLQKADKNAHKVFGVQPYKNKKSE